MQLYNVTVTRIGSVELYAASPEEAMRMAEITMRMAEETNQDQLFWMDNFLATDAKEINKESQEVQDG